MRGLAVCVAPAAAERNAGGRISPHVLAGERWRSERLGESPAESDPRLRAEARIRGPRLRCDLRLVKFCDAPEELTGENGHRIALREKIGRVRQDYVELLLAEKLQPELLDENAARKPINALHQNRADICVQALIHKCCEPRAARQGIGAADGRVRELECDLECKTLAKSLGDFSRATPCLRICATAQIFSVHRPDSL